MGKPTDLETVNVYDHDINDYKSPYINQRARAGAAVCQYCGDVCTQQKTYGDAVCTQCGLQSINTLEDIQDTVKRVKRVLEEILEIPLNIQIEAKWKSKYRPPSPLYWREWFWKKEEPVDPAACQGKWVEVWKRKKRRGENSQICFLFQKGLPRPLILYLTALYLFFLDISDEEKRKMDVRWWAIHFIYLDGYKKFAYRLYDRMIQEKGKTSFKEMEAMSPCTPEIMDEEYRIIRKKGQHTWKAFIQKELDPVDIRKEYERWLACASADSDMVNELKTMEYLQIRDAFYRNLAFGTDGLRGVIGAGTNRVNIYTMAKVAQALANYLKKQPTAPSVVIGYDSRMKSEAFAKVTASVFAANGMRVHIWAELMPSPAVSFAVRYFRASMGVMITASSNSAEYNGCKVYGADGGQMTAEAADEVLEEMEALDILKDVRAIGFEMDTAKSRICHIEDEVYTAFVEEVKEQSVLFGDEADKNIGIVYSPFHGTGLGPVTRTLEEMGYTNMTVVKEQEQPDGRFPTCRYPNPELREAMSLGMKYAKDCNADLLLATDPDCDRVGIAVRNEEGGYELLSGNQVGVLLFDYICSQRIRHKKMPATPVMVKTIVTTDMAEQIAAHYGVQTLNALTGFQSIGEQIGKLEQRGKTDRFIFGFDESCGYLTGSYVRDKDGVGSAYMICEMFSYYAMQGISLPDKLEELYQTYGYCVNMPHSYVFDGSAGFAKMQSIMQIFRGKIRKFGGKKVVKLLDYSQGLDGLPKSDVLRFLLEDHCSIVVCPSGTEPRLKLYVSVSAKQREAAEQIETVLVKDVEQWMEQAR